MRQCVRLCLWASVTLLCHSAVEYRGRAYDDRYKGRQSVTLLIREEVSAMLYDQPAMADVNVCTGE